MKNKSILIIGIITILFALTNPPLEEHKAALKSELYKSMNLTQELNQVAEKDNQYEAAGGALGMSLGMDLVDKMVNNMVTRDNYALFSLTRVNIDGTEKIMGLGVVGNVFLFQDFNRSGLN